MKLTIKSNGIMKSANVENESYFENGEKQETENVHSVEIDFVPSVLFSDFELWLEDENGELCDYKRIVLTPRNKLKMN